MNTHLVFLAQAGSDPTLAWWHWTNPAFRELVYISFAIAWITLLLLIWAAFIRRKRRRHHSHHHHHHHESKPAGAAADTPNEEEPAQPERRRRRRRSHHRHRPRNPTLAETGGLPPIRSEDTPDAKL
jgi:hypothetical protein